ncbi:MAG: hypothetical protein WA977_08655 [Halobacteriota archaeon]
MDEKEKERRWKELITNEGVVVSNEKLVRRKERLGWRKELVSDLWLLVILLVFWIGFVSVVEVLKYGL